MNRGQWRLEAETYEAFVSAESEGTVPVVISYESGNGPCV